VTPARWHAITCQTCGNVLASGLFPPGFDHAGPSAAAFREAHRNVDGCPATHVVLAPRTAAEVIARLDEDVRREPGA
jgi:hypothetical protein